MQDRIYYAEERREILRFLPSRYLRVLEIGCGEGIFASSLNPDAETWGIEPNKLSASAASTKMYRVFNSFYDDCYSDLPDNYFDLVICNDVIEHMPDHDRFFESIKKKMTAEGVLIGSIPNVRYFENIATFLILKDWKYAASGILDRTHLRYFTYKSLLRAFSENGYIIQEIKGIQKLKLTPFSLWRLVKWLAVYAIVLITLGYYRDIPFLQFGFRVKPN